MGLSHPWPRAIGTGALAASLVLWACPATREEATPETAPRRPNVLLISVDSLRPDHLGCYGYDRATSPYLDRLARGAVRFRHAIAQGAGTFSSVPALVTSRYPYEHADVWVGEGVGDGVATRLAADAPTTGRILRDAGYETALVSGHQWIKMMVGIKDGLDSVEIGDFRAEEVTSRAIRILERRRLGNPLFLWLHYMDPHHPYAPPPPYDTRFLADGKRITGKLLPLSNEMVAPGAITRTVAIDGRRDLDFYVARYDGEIAYLDEQLGRLNATLVDLGVSRDTIVVVTADHGESFGEQGIYFRHNLSLHAAITNIPLLVAWPSKLTARTVDAPVMAVDILPTIAELAGLPPDPRWAGRSLVGCAKGGACPTVAYASRGGTEAAMRTDRWKIICTGSGRTDEDPTCRLYDVQADPMEARDMATLTPDVAMVLRRRLTDWMRAHPDPRRRGPTGWIAEPDPELTEALRALGYVR